MLRVLTYNLLEGGRDPYMGDRTDTILSVLKKAEPDVAVLTEANGLEEDARRRHFEDETDSNVFVTAAASGFHIAFLVAKRIKVAWHRVQPGRFFHAAGAVAIPLEVLRASRKPEEPRFITVVGAHLDPFSPESRLSEARNLAGLADTRERVLLMGDFNSLPTGDPVDPSVTNLPPRILARHVGIPDENGQFDTRMHDVLHFAGFVDVYRQVNPKTPGWTLLTTRFAAELRSRMRLDYIYATPKLAGKAVRAEVIESDETRRASDHYPLLAEFDI